jgi:hypothetical protein
MESVHERAERVYALHSAALSLPNVEAARHHTLFQKLFRRKDIDEILMWNVLSVAKGDKGP